MNKSLAQKKNSVYVGPGLRPGQAKQSSAASRTAQLLQNGPSGA
jgi:hypothetical protein